jgi:hypothetical protein
MNMRPEVDRAPGATPTIPRLLLMIAETMPAMGVP